MRSKDIHMNKRAVTIIIALAVVIVSGGVTFALLSFTKGTGGNHAAANKTPKQKADDTNAEAIKLLNETTKMGSGKEADKKTQEAAAKFEEASKLYKQAGDNSDSYAAQANADSLRSRLAAEEPFKKQQEAEWAKQKADMEAAKAAMAANSQ
jgi:flagellar basal body-associated protein FliL